jgi:DNA-binding protein HU-beta
MASHRKRAAFQAAFTTSQQKQTHMNKAELIEAVSASTGDSKAAAGRNVEAVIAAITQSLKRGKNVTLVGFGTFRVAKRAARKGVNPQTQQPIKIPAAK